MCGRYTLATPVDVLVDELELQAAPEVTPRYNIAPTQESLIVVRSGDARSARKARWGFGTEGGRPMFNARSETVSAKPTFRDSFERRRCLVPADGFYEWRGRRGERRPSYFNRADGRPMMFAGLWERWSPDTLGSDRPTCAFTILTTAANELVAGVHDRMPVILEETSFALWLDPRTPTSALSSPLASYPADLMSLRRVGRTVNNVRIDSPACLQAPRQTELDLLTDSPR